MAEVDRPLQVLNLHWGFSLGGVAKYTALIDQVGNYAPIEMDHLCIIGRAWPTDEATLSRLNAQRIMLGSRVDISWLWKVRREIARVRPDLLMTNGFNGHFVALIATLGRKASPPIVCSYHSFYHATTPARRLFVALFDCFTVWFLRRRALAVITVAEVCKRDLVARGVPAEKVAVIHNGIENSDAPPDARDAVRAEWGIADDETVILTASRLDPVKGLEYLIDAFDVLAREQGGIRLVILGRGPLKEALENQTRQLGLANKVVFAGYRPDIGHCLAGADIFALPSLAESHSIALLEAMRAGLAIVATDVGGNGESVREQQEALLVPSADVGAFVRALKQLAGDSDLRRTFGDNAKKRYEDEFTVARMVKRTARWLVRCAAKAGGSYPNNIS